MPDDMRMYAETGYGLHGASRTKTSLRGFQAGGGDPERDISRNLKELRIRARDMDMGGGIARSATRTLATNAVGYGLMPKPKPDAEFLGMQEEKANAWKKDVMREWRLWAGSVNCDAERQRTFYELQELAFLSQLLSGDVFVTMPYIPRKGSLYDLRIRLIEADLCVTPAEYRAGVTGRARNGNLIEDGVEIGPQGDVVAYYIASKHPLGSDRDIRYDRVPAFGIRTGRPLVLHLMPYERPGQRRGVPFIASEIEMLKQADRYQLSELAANLVNSMFAVFIQTDTGAVPEDGEPMAPDMGGWATGDARPDESGLPGDMAMSPGMIIGLKEGEKANGVSPQRNTGNYDAYTRSIATQIGAGLETPRQTLLKDFDSSYSAARAAQLEYWKTVRKWRPRFVDGFCQVIYEEWLTEAVAKGRIVAPGFFDDPAVRAAYCECEWIGPSQGQIDPLKEINAAIARVQLGVSTREREAAEINGSEFDLNAAQLRRESELMAAMVVPQQGAEKEEGDEKDEDEKEK